MEGFNTKCLTSLLQSYQGLGHSKQEKSEKLSLSGGAEKNLKSVYCGFWITFWRRNMASVKTNESS